MLQFGDSHRGVVKANMDTLWSTFERRLARTPCYFVILRILLSFEMRCACQLTWL